LRLNFVDPRIGSRHLLQMRIVAGERKLDLDAIRESLEKNLESRSCGLQLEAKPAGGEHGGLEFNRGITLETDCVAKVAYGSPCGSGKSLVGVHLQNNGMVLRRQRHGVLAQETSQASRHSGQ
jgi:hypothetical protein